MLHVNCDSENHLNSGRTFITSRHPLKYTTDHVQTTQEMQTDPLPQSRVQNTGAQYSSPSDSSDSHESDSDSDIEGTENITVAKRYLNRRSLSSEDLYTAPTQSNKWFCTSTPDPSDRKPENEPIRCPLKEIINHRPALNIPPVTLTVAPDG